MSANLTTLERDFNALVDIINSQEYDNSSPGLSVSDVERFQENLRGKDYCDFEGEKLPDLHKILNTILHVISTDSTILAIRLSHLVDKRLYGNEEDCSSDNISDDQREFIVKIATNPRVNNAKAVKNAILCLGFEGQKQLAIACHQRITEEIDGIVLALDLRQSRDGNFIRILFSEVLRESQGFGRIINSQGRQVCDQAGEIRSLSASNAALEAENARLVEENEELRSAVQSALNGSQDFATQQSFHAGSLVREDR